MTRIHSLEQRLRDLMARMTIHEKVAQLSCIMPSLLMGRSMPDPALMEKYLPQGLGRMTQFSSTFLNSPVDIARCANAIQKWVRENTRLGIPVLFQNESVSGLTAIEATIFPSPINMAASWHPELVEQAAGIIRTQMRALGLHKALAPVLDLAQDPRWGRLNETFGEDPYLSASIGTAYIRGLQTKDVSQGVAACAKHFLGYSVTKGGLNLGEVNLTERDLLETFAFPFAAAIDECDLKSIMVTYSSVNGVPASINKPLLRGVLRGRLGYRGNVLCDGGSIEMCVNHQHVCKTNAEAGILAIEAGLEANTPVSEAFKYLPEAVEQGKVKIELIDEAVEHVLRLKFELGMFENPFVDEGRVQAAFAERRTEHDAVSRQLAEESLILIKNDGGLLPLDGRFRRIAAIGPHLDTLRAFYSAFTVPASVEMYQQLFRGSKKQKAEKTSMGGVSDAVEKDLKRAKEKEEGNYGFESFFHEVAVDFASIDVEQFIRDHYHSSTLLEALRRTAGVGVHIDFARGCDYASMDRSGFPAALELAGQAEAVILALGDISGWVSGTAGEGHDSTTLRLPGVQQELLEAVAGLGKPVVLVLFDGRPHDLLWASEHVPAILDVWTAGPQGAEAVASALFGRINPGGKLPLGIPRSVGQVPVTYNHRIASGYLNPFGGPQLWRPEDTDGYVNEPASPLYPFGHGLSYTSFAYSELQILPGEIALDGSLEISCRVANTGARAGAEVVQLYMFDREAPVVRPVRKLIGFKRLSLEVGESRRVSFRVDARQFEYLNADYEWVVEPGAIDLLIGSSSKDIRLNGQVQLVGDQAVTVQTPVYFSKAV